MMTHVLDATRDGDIVGAHGDATGDVGHGGHGTGAHPVDGIPGHGLGQPGQQRGGAADGQALVTGLRGGGDGNLVDPLGRQLRITPHQLPDTTDHQVVGAGLGIHATRLAERSADAVNEDDLAAYSGHNKPPCRRTQGMSMLLVGNFVAYPGFRR
jgi:hypothetical protein